MISLVRIWPYPSVSENAELFLFVVGVVTPSLLSKFLELDEVWIRSTNDGCEWKEDSNLPPKKFETHIYIEIYDIKFVHQNKFLLQNEILQGAYFLLKTNFV